jgi:hypothetical protein
MSDGPRTPRASKLSAFLSVREERDDVVAQLRPGAQRAQGLEQRRGARRRVSGGRPGAHAVVMRDQQHRLARRRARNPRQHVANAARHRVPRADARRRLNLRRQPERANLGVEVPDDVRVRGRTRGVGRGRDRSHVAHRALG